MREFLWVALLCVCSCAKQSTDLGEKKERIADEITKKVAQQLREEKDLIPCGSGGGMMHEIRMLALSFDYRKPMDVKIGRELLVASVKTYLDAVNSNKEVRSYLDRYPFDSKNIEIRIFCDLTKEPENDPTKIRIISAIDGVLKYQVYDASGHLKTIYKETYEEAVQKLQGIETIDVTQSLRILELIPRKDRFFSLAIEPAVPNNFAALSQSGEISYSGHVFWGPKSVLEDYFKDPSSLSEPILQVLIARGVGQTKRGCLDIESLRKEMSERKEIQKFSIEENKWGDYPIAQLSVTIGGEKFEFAYVGLNDPSSSILLFRLIAPKTTEGAASGMKLWQQFIKETVPLTGLFRLKAEGEELHAKYTIFDIAGNAKVKLVAEKRRSDQKIQIAVLPLEGSVQYSFVNALFGKMKGDWHPFEPIVLIEGTYIVDNGYINLAAVNIVLIQEVDEFTPIPGSVKNAFVKTL